MTLLHWMRENTTWWKSYKFSTVVTVMSLMLVTSQWLLKRFACMKEVKGASWKQFGELTAEEEKLTVESWTPFWNEMF